MQAAQCNSRRGRTCRTRDHLAFRLAKLKVSQRRCIYHLARSLRLFVPFSYFLAQVGWPAWNATGMVRCYPQFPWSGQHSAVRRGRSYRTFAVIRMRCVRMAGLVTSPAYAGVAESLTVGLVARDLYPIARRDPRYTLYRLDLQRIRADLSQRRKIRFADAQCGDQGAGGSDL